MTTKTKALIDYREDGEWSGIRLTERPDGTWKLETRSQVQDTNSGRVAIIRPPAWWSAEDKADMESYSLNPCATKAQMLLWHGTEIRCLRRGHIVQ